MPVLTNALHERFAQNLARGMNGTAAAKDAGYCVNSGCWSIGVSVGALMLDVSLDQALRTEFGRA